MKTHFLALIAPLVLGSCGSILSPVEDAAVHYLLTPAIPERTVTGSKPGVAISPPALPDYLDRQQLVSRTGEGILQMNSIHLWGESLDAGISRVIAENLRRLTNSLSIQPAKNYVTMDYETLLEIRIVRFEPDANNLLTLDCTWKAQPVAGGVAPMRSFVTRIPIPAADPLQKKETGAGPQTARIRAMNEALARLSREIARAL